MKMHLLYYVIWDIWLLKKMKLFIHHQYFLSVVWCDLIKIWIELPAKYFLKKSNDLKRIHIHSIAKPSDFWRALLFLKSNLCLFKCKILILKLIQFRRSGTQKPEGLADIYYDKKNLKYKWQKIMISNWNNSIYFSKK